MKARSLILSPKKWLKTCLSAVLAGFILFSSSAYAAQEDVYSWQWWSDLSGLTTGTVNDIMYTYLGAIGYTGSVHDRLFNWLVDQTGLPATSTLNDLIYSYFVAENRGGTLTFLSVPLAFLGETLTFNH